MGCSHTKQKEQVYPIIRVTEAKEASCEDAGSSLHDSLDSQLVEIDSMSIQCDWLDEFEMPEGKLFVITAEVIDSLKEHTRNLSYLPRKASTKSKNDTNLKSCMTAGTRNNENSLTRSEAIETPKKLSVV
eukprot:TRINITY_DN11412_c0_g1_i6.p1 TRINITY_DN11412_c0_g1~~TRINITY_DN11412_c0_g1_i6.p1  ORF type:complete len:130 (+),score=23.92 TRINITY_DN11412_c0_g1_i6:509-898(+)